MNIQEAIEVAKKTARIAQSRNRAFSDALGVAYECVAALFKDTDDCSKALLASALRRSLYRAEAQEKGPISHTHRPERLFGIKYTRQADKHSEPSDVVDYPWESATKSPECVLRNVVMGEVMAIIVDTIESEAGVPVEELFQALCREVSFKEASKSWGMSERRAYRLVHKVRDRLRANKGLRELLGR